jgi:3-methyladenine DNA glycosylase AlkD
MLKKFRFTSKKKDKTVANQLIGKTNSEKLDVIISEIVSIKKDVKDSVRILTNIKNKTLIFRKIEIIILLYHY